MRAGYMVIPIVFGAAVVALGCVRFDGLDEDLSVYGQSAGAARDGGLRDATGPSPALEAGSTQPDATTPGQDAGPTVADTGLRDSGPTCTPSCPSTCRTSAVSDGCGGSCAANCAASCVGGVCKATTDGLVGAGLNDCGPSANESCALSPLVSGGTFFRGTDTANPATISDFRLDKYEVTVGRFRKFVDAWVGGWRPPVASGKHTHLNGGQGLANTAGGNEPGWDSTWTAYVGAPSNGGVAPTGAGAADKAAWDTNLNCSSGFATWTSAAGSNEKRPMNCLSWYDLHAFCVWDGGFLPSEAEWEYATAGGSEERTYAWGSTAPGSNTALAIYGCYYNGTGSCSGVTNIATVGTVAAGAGKWGQLDLAGNVFEWNLDWYQGSYVASCNNCTNLTAGSYRVIRGGSFNYDASNLPAADRYNLFNSPADRDYNYGGRCARTP